MKSDSERQLAYQQRRLETETRLSCWLPHEVQRLVDQLRQNALRKYESRETWVNRAITTLVYMQLLNIKFTDIISDEQAEIARKRARDEFGVELP